MAEEIREKVLDWEDAFQVSPDFKEKLNNLLEEELQRLEKVLADL